MSAIDNREQWLTEAASILLDARIMPHTSRERPPFRVTLGWPKHTRGASGVVAQCFARKCSSDGVNEIFVTPEIDNPGIILPVLVHELVHAVLDLADGHRGEFKRLAMLAGLQAPFTCSISTPDLDTFLHTLSGALGPFPHHKMDTSIGHKKQPIRQLKVECLACSFLARASASQMRRWQTHNDSCPCCGNTLIFNA